MEENNIFMKEEQTKRNRGQKEQSELTEVTKTIRTQKIVDIHRPSKQKRARLPEKPEFRLGHEDRRKKVNNNHRRSSTLMKSHPRRQHRCTQHPYWNKSNNQHLRARIKTYQQKYKSRRTKKQKP
jgi:hypothetical protein